MTGLMSWCRSEKGQINKYKTYGHPLGQNFSLKENYSFFSSQKSSQPIAKDNPDVAVNNIRKFWELSSPRGESDYLKMKGVGLYRIRFRANQYGKVAVIPLQDVRNKLCGYQILNANGSKVFAKGIRIPGLFHQLTDLTDGLPIGIAEGYVTAATCLELIDVSMVAAFTCDNLAQVAVELSKCYPWSPLIFFADNDRHLTENKGMNCAFQAIKQIKSEGVVIAPQFDNYPRARNYSDWNDLVREIGHQGALGHMLESLSHVQCETIKHWYDTTCKKNLAV